MTKATHTPGPWSYTLGAHEARYIIDSEPGHAIGCTAGFEPLNEANARLFSTAPDLLAALEKAVEQYGKGGGPWNVPDEPGTWLHDARDAIRKAKGEA